MRIKEIKPRRKKSSPKNKGPGSKYKVCGFNGTSESDICNSCEFHH